MEIPSNIQLWWGLDLHSVCWGYKVASDNIAAVPRKLCSMKQIAANLVNWYNMICNFSSHTMMCLFVLISIFIFLEITQTQTPCRDAMLDVADASFPTTSDSSIKSGPWRIRGRETLFLHYEDMELLCMDGTITCHQYKSGKENGGLKT